MDVFRWIHEEVKFLSYEGKAKWNVHIGGKNNVHWGKKKVGSGSDEAQPAHEPHPLSGYKKLINKQNKMKTLTKCILKIWR